ncbi:DUF58 domain-containing protein [Halomicroarcula sp. GCM10025709]|uniref:DUF58 domain-containing protein n=1 Tax=Haloarcula TaxID=2237 RepID=UPI0024C33201|nr:DUF58 domain-containing protein [Halomicroarcula sp. YJ-61-S]
MTLLRRLSLGAGVCLILAGFGVAAGGTSGVTIERGFVVFVGLLAAGLAVYAGYRRYATPQRTPRLPDRGVRDVSPPEPATDGAGAASTLTRDYRVADDLQALLQRALVRSRERDEAGAETAIHEGNWTDDPTAAALFADAVERTRQYRDRIAARTTGRSRYRYRVERVAAELRSVLGIDAVDEAPAERATTPANGVVETGRWAGFYTVPLGLVGVGIVGKRPALVLAGAAAVVALAVRAGASTPDPSVTVDRAVSETAPTHGDEVTVTLTVRNDGDRTLTDCRIADGVPDTLAVTDGTPQLATALRPERTATVEYTVRATRGDHEFAAPTVVATDAVGATATVADASVTGVTALSVSLPAIEADAPVQSQTTRHRGRIDADQGGDGIAFYATREYRPGDPLSRIDWNRYAGTRELSTLEFREEQAATVVVLVDARPGAYEAPAAPELDATVDRSVIAARSVIESRLDAEDRVGLAALSPDRLFIGPSGGPTHKNRLETTLAADPVFRPSPPDGEFYPGPTLRWLRRELPASAQVVCCSPLVDDDIRRILRYLAAYGHAVTVVSPDPGVAPTADGTVAAADRLFRISELRREGIPVVDWHHGEPLAAAFERAREWSR